MTHLSTSLLPPKVYDAGGNLVVERPMEYDPPANNFKTDASTVK
jgi:hypothetical protein